MDDAVTDKSFRGFSRCKSASDVAEVLGVPLDAVFCVELTEETCGVKGCPYQAAARNGARGVGGGPRCVRHQKTWFPKNNERGHFLIGPEHLRALDGTRNVCFCSNSFCRGIGYYPNMVRVSKNKVDQVLGAFKICGKEAEKFKSELKNRPKWIAPWHFHPQHRERDKNGLWRLKGVPKDQRFVDWEKRVWIGFPPPNYKVKFFYEDELGRGSTRVLPTERWKYQSRIKTNLPDWVSILVSNERSLRRRQTHPPPVPQSLSLPLHSRRVSH